LLDKQFTSENVPLALRIEMEVFSSLQGQPDVCWGIKSHDDPHLVDVYFYHFLIAVVAFEHAA
jgi:hypothetical protein